MVTLRYRIHMLWWIWLRSGTEFTCCGGLRSGTEFTCCCGYVYTQVQIGFPVVITLRVITRNTFFHLRRSITRNYAFITFTKESLAVVDMVTLRYRIHMLWWIGLRSGTEFKMLWWIWLRSGTEFTCCDGYGYALVQNSHAVVDTVTLRYRICILWRIWLRSGT